MQTFFEILKYILPALVVFVTVYYLMKQYLDQQYKLSQLEMRKDQYDNTLPIKLQAYERLAMFCERISADNLSYRLMSSTTDAKSLANGMLIAIQQEWEHNLSQQIYVSDKLWSIISLAKNNEQSTITDAAQLMSSGSSANDLIEEILNIKSKQQMNPLGAAARALKEEVQLLF